MTSKDTSAAAAAAAANVAVEKAKEAAAAVLHTAEVTAAALVKFTSDNAVLTANIEFIKKDLADLKADFKDSKLKYIDASQHAELCKSNADHENRIRLIEVSVVQTKTWGTALIVAAGIVEFLIQKFVK